MGRYAICHHSPSLLYVNLCSMFLPEFIDFYIALVKSVAGFSLFRTQGWDSEFAFVSNSWYHHLCIILYHSQVHIAAAECLLELTNQYKAAPPVIWQELGFMTELLELTEVEKSEQAKSLLKKCIDILGKLKENVKSWAKIIELITLPPLVLLCSWMYRKEHFRALGINHPWH